MRDLFFDRVFRSPQTSANYRMGMSHAQLFLISNLIPVLPDPVTVGEAPMSPPYEVVWFEWAVGGMLQGALVLSERVDNDGWMVVILPAAKMGLQKSPMNIPLGFRFKLDGSGRSATPDKGLVIETGPGVNGTMLENKSDTEIVLAEIFPPVVFALTMLHCKNVSAIETGGPSVQRGGRSSRSHLRRHHVLQVRPMGGKSVSNNRGQHESVAMSLHFVRGHFKTYTDDAPLFGRLTGSYWWESHARGDASVGIVTKDYNVNSPIGNGDTP